MNLTINQEYLLQLQDDTTQVFIEWFTTENTFYIIKGTVIGLTEGIDEIIVAEVDLMCFHNGTNLIIMREIINVNKTTGFNSSDITLDITDGVIGIYCTGLNETITDWDANFSFLKNGSPF